MPLFDVTNINSRDSYRISQICLTQTARFTEAAKISTKSQFITLYN